ncbi:MAG: response regulator [Bryobacteraceae bacterium]
MAGSRILVVEDEAIVTADLRSKLERLGYIVCAVAFSGEDAIRQADETTPDLILMDVRLQGTMTGFEAAARIQKHRAVPVVYITAHTAVVEDAVEAPEKLLCLAKPFLPGQLQRVLEAALVGGSTGSGG